jgi:hypothetical protein
MEAKLDTQRAARRGWIAVGALALVKLLIHLATTGRFGYEYFVDELYYLALAEHLDWGYVDLPPLFPVITAMVRWALGDSLLAVRLLPALAGAALVVLTGRFARRLGGGPFAQGLAALAVITAPVYLVFHGIHTMNALEPLIWTGCAWLLVEIRDGRDPRLWLALGALAGLGLLNKHSLAFFGVAVVAALVALPERRLLRGRWPWLGALVALAVFLPNLVWLIAHRFPHFASLARIARDGRNVELAPLEFLGQQALMLHPVAAPLWLAGLGWLLFARDGRRYRILALAYLGVIALMLLLDGRVYYAAPAYPMLLAAGGVAVERWLARRRSIAWWAWLRPAYPATLAAAGALLAPLFLPCLPPASVERYSRAIGLEQPRVENHRLGPLPQLFADRFGWREMAETVARIYHGLPEAEKRRAAIFGQNYGQAGAVDLYGPRLGLPKALSGHLTYHDWGPRGYTGDVVIVLDDDRETLEGHFERVEWAARVDHPYSMPYQHFDVFVCRGLRHPLAEVWPGLRELG